MIYFLGFQEASGRGLFGVYTREAQLTYPRMREGSHFILTRAYDKTSLENIFEPEREYTARLLCIDYQGWVPLIADQQFIV